MKSENLLDLIGDIPDQYITEAVPEEKSKKRFIRPRRIILAASCLAAVLTAVYIMSNFPEYINSFVPSSTDTESQQNTSDTGSQTEPGTGSSLPDPTEISTAGTFDWEKEKADDPIFDWVDPYPGMDITDLYEILSEDEVYDIMLKRDAFLRAQVNYKAYYYYQSGRSEFDGTRLGINEKYTSPAYYAASYVYPDDIINNIRSEACLVLRPVGTFTTTHAVIGDEATLEKDSAMGESGTYEMTHIICEVESCLWGEFECPSRITLGEILLSTEFVNELTDTDKTFVAYIYKHFTNAETGEQATFKYRGETLTEYGVTTESCFALEDGILHSYSDVADVYAFEGKTPEELTAAVAALKDKYGVEMLESLVKSGTPITFTA